jgi:small-conductance mechanosensitive channel
MTAPKSIVQTLDATATIVADWIASHSLDILIAAASGALLVGLLYGLKRLGRKLIGHPNEWRSVIGRALVSMRFWFMVMVAAEIVASSANAPAPVARTVHILFVIASALQAAIFLRELILGAIELRAGGEEASGNLGNAFGLIRLLVSVVLFILAIILILSNVGVNVTGLIAGLGIGGIAIGLAAQGIFSDLFAALSILLDKPFRRGDVVAFETFRGTVEYIGLKSTRLRAVTGEEIIVSNTNLLAKVLRNTSHMTHRRIVQMLGIGHKTKPDLCAALPELLRGAIDAVPGCRYLRCGLENLGASSLDYKLIYEIDGEDPDELLINQHTANLAILRLFDAHDIDFAASAAAVPASVPPVTPLR